MLKVQRTINGEVIFAVSGRLAADTLGELSAVLASERSGRTLTLELKDLVLVDRDAVGFLHSCEEKGIALRNCPPYSGFGWPAGKTMLDVVKPPDGMPDPVPNQKCPTLAWHSIRISSQRDLSPHPMTDVNGKIRILVVDDQPLLREGIAAVLNGKSDLEIVGEASDSLEAIKKTRSLQPDVTVMDLHMPRLSGIDAIHAIRHETPNARIVILTTTTGDLWARCALNAGAASYVLKARVHTELVDIIRSVYHGARHIEPAIAVKMAEYTNYQMPTSREVEVLDLMAAGNSNKLIARALTISEETAKTHVKNIIAKLRARDRTHAVALGLRRGVIQL